MRCPLCGFVFDETDLSCRTRCPLGKKSCDVICCPHCHYSFVETSRTIQWIERVTKKLRRSLGVRSDRRTDR